MTKSIQLAFLITFILSACAPALPSAIATSRATITASNTPPPDVTPTATSPPSPTPATVNEDRSGCIISAPPSRLELDPAYEKYCDANGIPIIGLAPVSDKAMRQAYYLVINFFAPIPDYLATMIENGGMLAIYGRNQNVRDVPATYTFALSKMPNVAGLGGTLSQPVTVTHESDLDGRWRPCNRVTIHELGHALRDIVLASSVRGFLFDSNDTFAIGFSQGLWDGAYASVNADENWAEGLNAYFSTYSDSNGTNYVRNRADLASYDPGLFNLIEGVFNGFEWAPTCP